MINRFIISSIFSLLLYILIQVFVFKNLVLFGTAFCFIYVFYILLLPIEVKTVPMLFTAFVLGLSIDVFYDTMGMHTASILLVAFLRKPWIQINTPTGGYDENLQPSILNMGPGWFITYSLPLILIHHVCFFYIDNLGTELYIPTVNKIWSSSIFTLSLGLMVQLLFYSRKRGI